MRDRGRRQVKEAHERRQDRHQIGRLVLPEGRRRVHAGPDREAPLAADVARLAGEWRAALGAFDPGLAISLVPAPADDPAAGRALSPADAAAVVGLLLAGPHGVEAMSPDIAGLVQTSTNMGLCEQKDGAVEVNFLTRSSIDASKRALAARIAAVLSRLRVCRPSIRSSVSTPASAAFRSSSRAWPAAETTNTTGADSARCGSAPPGASYATRRNVAGPGPGASSGAPVHSAARSRRPVAAHSRTAATFVAPGARSTRSSRTRASP